MYDYLLKLIFFLVHLIVSLATIAALTYGFMLIQVYLHFNQASFSHYEFLGMAIIFGVVYFTKTYKKSSATPLDLVLFICFSITSLAVVVLPALAAIGSEYDTLDVYILYGFACWITLGIVASAAQGTWRYNVRYLYAWYTAAATSIYIAILPIMLLPLTPDTESHIPTIILGLATLILLAVLAKHDRRKHQS